MALLQTMSASRYGAFALLLLVLGGFAVAIYVTGRIRLHFEHRKIRKRLYL